MTDSDDGELDLGASGRQERLRSAVLAIDPEVLREALAAMPDHWVTGLAARARIPLPVLRRSKDPTNALRRLEAERDEEVLGQIAGVVAHECLESIRDALGDSADNPSREELAAGVDAVLAQGFQPPMVSVMLASVVHAQAEASDLCDELLKEDARFIPPDAPEATPTGFSIPVRHVDEEEAARKRAARKERRAKKK